MDDDEVERPEDDDYDLLTFGEAGARLQQEVNRERRRLRELEDPTASSSSEKLASEIASVRTRLDALLEAQVRNSKGGDHLRF
jgi:hypothetical protein